MFRVSSERIFTRACILQVAAVPVTEEGNLVWPGYVVQPTVEAKSLMQKQDARLNSNLNNSQT